MNSKYIPKKGISQDVNWLGEAQKNVETWIKISYHKDELRKIREAFGNKCKFLSFARYNNSYFLKLKLKGRKDPIVATLEGSPDDITQENYKDLKNQLLEYVN